MVSFYVEVIGLVGLQGLHVFCYTAYIHDWIQTMDVFIRDSTNLFLTRSAVFTVRGPRVSLDLR